MLIVFSGLPGTGKTTIARALATRLKAVYLRIDTIEQAVRVCLPEYEVTKEGYEVAYALAGDNLSQGQSVIADSVNPLALTRDAWRDIALAQGKHCLEIEILCSDAMEHRCRVEQRTSDIPGLKLPTWNDVLGREYEPWNRGNLVIDTAQQTPEASVNQIEQIITLVDGGMREAVATAIQKSHKMYDELYKKLAQ